MSTPEALAVKAGLRDPHRVCSSLGLLGENPRRQSGGYMVRCPAHGERTPSCLVNLDRGGDLWAHCFGCNWTGDAIALVAQVYDLDVRSQFREALALAAEVGGDHALAADIRDGKTAEVDLSALPKPEPIAARPYPDAESVSGLWTTCESIQSDADVWEALRGRDIDPDSVPPELAKALPGPDGLPDWARYQGRSWWETGHKLLIRAFDVEGQARSVRAWRVVEGDSPKRLPPSGCRSSELAMLNRAAWQGVIGGDELKSLWIVEGEPDWLSLSAAHGQSGIGVLGITSGTWTKAWAGRISQHTKVMVATHNDRAGDGYADRILDSLGKRHHTWRVRL